MRNNQFPQGGQPATNVPYIMPMPEIRQPTAEEIINKVITEVRAEKAKEKTSTIEMEELNLPKCDLHPKKLSINCRKCKKIKEQMDEIEKRKQKEKEKANPENRLREILGDGTTGHPEDIRNKKNPNMPMQVWGDASTFNMNELLRTHIKNSPYFNELFAFRTIPEITDEITKKAIHAEPWTNGAAGIPSTFFCCLYRMMMMRLTEKQIKELLDYQGSPYVRCAGFLYLRFCCNPEHLWDWFGKYFLDEEEVHPAADANVVMSIGEYAEMLLTDMSYYNTLFPRIPVVTDREIKKNILMMRERRSRKRKNMDYLDEFVKGAKIMAIAPEDNEWHEATLVRVEGWKIRVKFTNVKEEADDADFTLELLEKKFQGEGVFIGGEETVLDLGEVMSPTDTKEYLQAHGDEEVDENKKPEKMEEEEPKRSDRVSEEDGKRDEDSRKKRGKSSPSSSPSSSSSRSSSHGSRRKKDRKRGSKKHKTRKQRSRSSSGSSSDGSRSRHRKRKDDRKKYKERERERSRDRKRDKKRRDKERKESSPSRSKSKEKEESPKRVEKKKPEVKVKDKTDKYMERVLQMQAEEATASRKSDYAARPVSYKTSLSTNLPGAGRRKDSRSPSPAKKVVVVKQEGKRREEEEDTRAPKQKMMSAEAYEKLKKLKEQYGESSRSGGDYSQKGKDMGEGPDVLRLGN